MLKIVDVHRAQHVAGEYVVLQNQGLMTVTLQGWALCTAAYLGGDPVSAAREMFIFTQDVPIKPYTRVVLFTGDGVEGWQPTNDGKQAYVAYWRKRDPVWTRTDRINLLQIASTRRLAVEPEHAVARTA